MFKTDGSYIHSLEKASIQDLPEEFTYPFYYEPHPLCIEASEEIQEYLITQSDFEHNFGLDNSKAGLQIGKMFGVMIVEDSKRDIGYLAGFSGKLAEQNFIKGFVPPIYDTLDKTGFYKKGEAELNEINKQIESLESTSKYINAKELLDQLKSQFEAELKEFKALQFFFQSPNIYTNQRRFFRSSMVNNCDFVCEIKFTVFIIKCSKVINNSFFKLYWNFYYFPRLWLKVL